VGRGFQDVAGRREIKKRTSNISAGCEEGFS